MPAQGLDGYNIAYATHLYAYPGKYPESWQASFGFLRSIAPVLITEFGPVGSGDPPCPLGYVDDVLAYASSNELSWVAWAWFATGSPDAALDWCGFPGMFYAESDPTTPVLRRHALRRAHPIGALHPRRAVANPRRR